ncbi:MAG: response regulator [Pseudomonadota bacterium]|nr:response regulator [Pseudomonadota bacterium]
MTISVLVVDDSPIARKMIRKALPADWDISIQEAGDGDEALAIYRSGGIDVIFLDLTMPRMDGFTLLEKLQQDDLNCFVIVVSADVQPGARERAMKLGAIEFVPKPIDPQALREVLREYGVMV